MRPTLLWMRRLFGALAFCVAMGSSPLVWADAVPPPPTNCPQGAAGETGHGGEYCAPQTCQSDQDCKGGNVCRDAGLCELSRSYCGGRPPPDGNNCSTITEALKVCKEGDDCGTATCVVAKRCVAPGASEPVAKPDTPSSTEQGGGSANERGGVDGPGAIVSVCGCSSASLPVSGGLLLLMLVGFFRRVRRD